MGPDIHVAFPAAVEECSRVDGATLLYSSAAYSTRNLLNDVRRALHPIDALHQRGLLGPDGDRLLRTLISLKVSLRRADDSNVTLPPAVHAALSADLSFVVAQSQQHGKEKQKEKEKEPSRRARMPWRAPTDPLAAAAAAADRVAARLAGLLPLEDDEEGLTGSEAALSTTANARRGMGIGMGKGKVVRKASANRDRRKEREMAREKERDEKKAAKERKKMERDARKSAKKTRISLDRGSRRQRHRERDADDTASAATSATNVGDGERHGDKSSASSLHIEVQRFSELEDRTPKSKTRAKNQDADKEKVKGKSKSKKKSKDKDKDKSKDKEGSSRLGNGSAVINFPAKPLPQQHQSELESDAESGDVEGNGTLGLLSRGHSMYSLFRADASCHDTLSNFPQSLLTTTPSTTGTTEAAKPSELEARGCALQRARDYAGAAAAYTAAGTNGATLRLARLPTTSTEERLRLLERLCAAGDAAGQFALAGVHLASGDAAAAAELYMAASCGGSAAAALALGAAYHTGSGVDAHPANAARQYRRAAALGSARAAYNLGVCHERGMGVTKVDVGKAVKLYEVAADRGSVPAMVALGMAAERGLQHDGVAQPAQAFSWYARAAGDDLYVDLDLEEEEGDEGDDEEGMKEEERKSNEKGRAKALYMLGRCYENGFGTRRDVAKARAQYEDAGRRGCRDAAAPLRKLVDASASPIRTSPSVSTVSSSTTS